jgi:ATP phosphoribosyltransferase
MRRRDMDEKQSLESNVHKNKLKYIEGGISDAKLLLYSGTESEKISRAELLLNYWIEKYNVLDEKEKNSISFNVFENDKNSIKVNINDLEKKAVKTLVEKGFKVVVSEELLIKYGYAPNKTKGYRQNPNTK